MSPVPLIQLQRRLAEAGRIRMGEKTDKGAPRRLTHWRITSPNEDLVKQAAGLYGGTPREWESPLGPQWEVVTEVAELPVLVMPGYSFRQAYEHRTSPTKVERRCDGQEMDDGSPCACNAEGFEGETCALITRLTVALPELTTLLGWRLETKGENAARELLASMDLVQGISAGRPFVPARLRIVERRGNVNGQAVRFVVPVVDVAVRFAELGIGENPVAQAALPVAASGHVPITSIDPGVSLSDGLALTERETRPSTRANAAAPIPRPDEEILFGEEPITVPAEPTEMGEVLATATAESKPLTKAMARDLDKLVGPLREENQITTVQLWAALARERQMETDQMIELLKGMGEDGILHWGPLRDSLSREEAEALRKRLSALFAKTRPQGSPFQVPEKARQ